MNITERITRIVFILAAFSVCAVANAQTGNAYGAYSPYTVFGIGDLHKEGTAFNKSMGGVGIATRNRRFINYMNPAAITAMDSCSFMADFGLTENNKIFTQNLDGQKLRSGNNTFNISDFVMAFPMYRSSAFMIGIAPFSSVGYDYSSYGTDPDIIGISGNYNSKFYGEGSVYQLFAGAGATFWKRLSVGAELMYYFGTLDKASTTDFTDSSIRDESAGSTILVRAVTGKFGLQYDQPLGKNLHLVVGGTYRMKTNMRGQTTQYTYAELSSIRDTIYHNVVNNAERLKFGDELGVGVSLRGGEKWSVEFDYLRSDWRGTAMGSHEALGYRTDGFSTSVYQSFRAGFEIVPNRNDIRYYLKKCAYRAGVYYDREYYKYNGYNVDAMGITLGVTLPVFRLYNGISLGVDFGQRGRMQGDLIRERYVTFSIGFNIHDIWFQKPRYE
ncbi:MAG: hypothetical protein K2J62_04970 [Bacteroidales bacterium]|nr:hypothetical protein [Bacteroidales bacterium]